MLSTPLASLELVEEGLLLLEKANQLPHPRAMSWTLPPSARQPANGSGAAVMGSDSNRFFSSTEAKGCFSPRITQPVCWGSS